MTYSIVACAAIGTDLAENTITLLLFTGHYLATAVVEFLILRSLPSSGSRCHSIFESKLEGRGKVRKSGLRWLEDVKNDLGERDMENGAKRQRVEKKNEYVP
jgi:hypothetical protein